MMGEEEGGEETLNLSAIMSQNSLGGILATSAACWIFIPCSSVPVLNSAFRPRRSCQRFKTSARIMLYKCPICGSDVLS